MYEISAEFRKRGIPVIFGGPHPTLAPEEVRAHCDVLVLGELESIAEQFFDDLYNGTYRREYVGNRAALDLSPVPRWDLYPNDRAIYGALQTSRGCPFECDFCDVIQYVGRKQRHKSVEQVTRELDTLYAAGYRHVFLSDDNLTVYKKRARDLLIGLRDWNAARHPPIHFMTQLSIEVSADLEMLELMAQANVRYVFIGIESTNEASMRETRKRQNVGFDMVERTERFARAGIQITSGLMVGFDHDGPDIFQQHLEFAQQTPIPNFNVSQLYAGHATPLRERMKAEGRLLPDIDAYGSPSAGTTPTNIKPAQMSHEELGSGAHWLIRKLYEPANFERRLMRMIELFPQREELNEPDYGYRQIMNEIGLRCHAYLSKSPDTLGVLSRVLRAVKKKPSARGSALNALMAWTMRMQQSDWVQEAPTVYLPRDLGRNERSLPVIQ
jgi:radical SAM superfamily enzyme YgiQ (UPF0313 family)